MRQRFRYIFGPALLVAAALTARGEDPAYTHELKPAYLTSDSPTEHTVGARFDFGVRRDFDRTAESEYIFADTIGTVAWRPEANPENMTAEVGLGAAHRFGGTVHLDLNQPIDPNAPNPVIPTGSGVHDFLVSTDLKVAFETDQKFQNDDVTFGPQVAFTQTENSGWWPLLPSVHIAYQRVHAITADYLASLNIPERDFWRVDASASWKWRPFERVGPTVAALRPLGLHADVRYFRSFDLPTPQQTLGLQQNFYTAETVSYETSNLGWKYVHAIYITLAQGRLPPSVAAQHVIYVGFTLLQ